MKNRFNNLTSKEWLPFQKSWFRFENITELYTQHIRFFSKIENTDNLVLYSGSNQKIIDSICKENKLKSISLGKFKEQAIQYAIIDLLDEINEKTTLNEYSIIKQKLISEIQILAPYLINRRFITIFIPNIQNKGVYFPFAWDLAKHISTILSLKDEKIGCYDLNTRNENQNYFAPTKDLFYCLNFRKDEHSELKYIEPNLNFFSNNKQLKSTLSFSQQIPSWFILKPKPRNKDEILHPAKYPEDLVELFLKVFTKVNDNVFDPMSGTGSTQLSALKMNRNGYGTELSDFFTDIALKRCSQYIDPDQQHLFDMKKFNNFKIINKDCRFITKNDFPEIDYLITSPPYWDMLNMKGAENQAKRVEKSLQTNYSEDEQDLGNINDYNNFLKELANIYFNIIPIIKPGSYITIIVKNIKKKGRNYPFAWDLANELQKKLILLPTTFWCQDDISIAPYGFGNTFVTNTFHQYCLNFQKPMN